MASTRSRKAQKKAPVKKQAKPKSPQRPSTRVTATTLETLGAARLAALLDDYASNDAALKRRLKLELAALHDPGALSREVRKRIDTLARSRAFVPWDGTRKLARDLDDQRRAIVDRIAPIDAGDALDLMWRFMSLARAIHERCDDSNGDIGTIFDAACGDLGRLAAAGPADAEALAQRCAAALFENGYGAYDGLIPVMAPALGPEGLRALQARVIEIAGRSAKKSASGQQREQIGWSSRGPIYRDDVEASQSEWVKKRALQDIADALGDVDSYITMIDEKARHVPKIAADVARRLLAAGRASEARDWLESATSDNRAGFFYGDWESVYIDVLEALGDGEAAQTQRWKAFENRLDADNLKAYLARLADFEDVEAEHRAIAHAAAYPHLTEAIVFLTHWPELDAAARMILARKDEINGNAWSVLPDCAHRLAGKHPLAATLLYRAMIDFTLREARAKRYRHAARHLLECESLASQIADHCGIDPHNEYVTRLRSKHARKFGFWGIVNGKSD